MSEQERSPEWLRELVESPVSLRMGLKDSDGPIQMPESRTQSESEYTFTLAHDKTTEQRRYRVRIDSKTEKLHCESWARYTFDLETEIETERDVKLILEVLTDDDSNPGSSEIEDTLTVTRADLDDFLDHPQVGPIAGARVAGLDKQKRTLRRFLEADNTDWGLSNQTGVLLEGPPGTGKTELVIELCQEQFGGMPVTISGPEILSKWVGESERLLRKQFDAARESTSKVLYIDEIDAIARSRSESTQEHSAQLVAQLLVLLDGVDAKTDDSLKVVASTNLAEVLDPALLRPGRLGNQSISFGRPDRLQRKAIFHHYLEQIRTSEEGQLDDLLTTAVMSPRDADFLEEIATSTDGYTGADIEDVILAAVTQLQADPDRSVPVLTQKDILQVVAERTIQPEGPSFTDETIAVPGDTVDPVSISGNGQLICLPNTADNETIRSVAHSWQQRADEQEIVLRTISGEELLGTTTTETRDRVVTAFQHESHQRLCLHIPDLVSIIRVSEHTPLAGTTIQAVYEQLLQWPDGNVLVYEQLPASQERLVGDHLKFQSAEK